MLPGAAVRLQIQHDLGFDGNGGLDLIDAVLDRMDLVRGTHHFGRMYNAMDLAIRQFADEHNNADGQADVGIPDDDSMESRPLRRRVGISEIAVAPGSVTVESSLSGTRSTDGRRRLYAGHRSSNVANFCQGRDTPESNVELQSLESGMVGLHLSDSGSGSGGGCAASTASGSAAESKMEDIAEE